MSDKTQGKLRDNYHVNFFLQTIHHRVFGRDFIPLTRRLCYHIFMSKTERLVIIPSDVIPHPSDTEISAAYILSEFFDADVKFIPRANHKTPDFLIDGTKWELKSPKGTGKYNIQHCLQDALKQSTYVIIDARASKQHMEKIRHELEHQMKLTKKVDRLLLITKSRKVIEIKR